jgi:predicted ArsR family transcriptional regulator
MGADGLSVKDDLLLQAILRGNSQIEAAAASGLSERTVRRHLADPAFKAALRAARDESVRRTSDALADGAARAVATLSALMDDATAPPAVRRTAARDLIQLSHRMRDQVDVIERLEELETALKEGGPR